MKHFEKKYEEKKKLKFFFLIFALKEVPTLSWSSFDALNFKPNNITLIYLILGLILFGLGETMLITASVGVSPWTVLAQGMSIKTGYSIGLTTFIISLGVLCLWLPLKQKPGIGTILNTIIISVVIDVSQPYLPSPELLVLQILQVTIGVLIVGLGSGFYLIANLGPGSRDGLMTGLQKTTGLPIALIRAIIEIGAVISGWYLGGIVGIGTIVFALGVGPCVSAGLFFVRSFIK